MIPDEAYTEAVEKKSVITLQREGIIPKGLSLDMLQLMQSIHDYDDIEEWENMFVYTAEEFGLEVPPMKSAQGAAR